MPVNNSLIRQIVPIVAANLDSIAQYLQWANQHVPLHLQNDIYSVFHSFIENDYSDVMWRHRPILTAIKNIYDIFNNRIQSNAGLQNGQTTYFPDQDTLDSMNYLLTQNMRSLLGIIYGQATANNMLANQPYAPLVRSYKWYATKEVAKGLYDVAKDATVAPVLALGGVACSTILHPVDAYNNVSYFAANPLTVLGRVASNAYDSAAYEMKHHPIRATIKIASLGLLFWGGSGGPAKTVKSVKKTKSLIPKTPKFPKSPPMSNMKNFAKAYMSSGKAANLNAEERSNQEGLAGDDVYESQIDVFFEDILSALLRDSHITPDLQSEIRDEWRHQANSFNANSSEQDTDDESADEVEASAPRAVI